MVPQHVGPLGALHVHRRLLPEGANEKRDFKLARIPCESTCLIFCESSAKQAWHTLLKGVWYNKPHTVCYVSQQPCLPCDKADMSGARHSRHDCCVTQQTCVLLHSRFVCCVTQQTCLLCATADLSAVSYSRHGRCATQQTCLLCHTANMSPVSYSRHVFCATQQTIAVVRQSRHCL